MLIPPAPHSLATTQAEFAAQGELHQAQAAGSCAPVTDTYPHPLAPWLQCGSSFQLVGSGARDTQLEAASVLLPLFSHVPCLEVAEQVKLETAQPWLSFLLARNCTHAVDGE